MSARSRLEECFTKEAQTRARAEAQAPEEAMQPDADVPEELTGQEMEIDHAQAQARRGPASVPTEPSSGSGGQAPSSAQKRDRVERAWGHGVLLTWMSRGERAKEEHDSSADHRWQMGEHVDANINAGEGNAAQ